MLSCLGAYARASLRFPVRQRLSRSFAPLLQLRRHTSACADSKPCSGQRTTRSARCRFRAGRPNRRPVCCQQLPAGGSARSASCTPISSGTPGWLPVGGADCSHWHPPLRHPLWGAGCPSLVEKHEGGADPGRGVHREARRPSGAPASACAGPLIWVRPCENPNQGTPCLAIRDFSNNLHGRKGTRESQACRNRIAVGFAAFVALTAFSQGCQAGVNGMLI